MCPKSVLKEPRTYDQNFQASSVINQNQTGLTLNYLKSSNSHKMPQTAPVAGDFAANLDIRF